jgi:hypothetical protein
MMFRPSGLKARSENTRKHRFFDTLKRGELGSFCDFLIATGDWVIFKKLRQSGPQWRLHL